MSNKKKIYSEGRIQGKFTPVRHEVLEFTCLEAYKSRCSIALYRPDPAAELNSL